MLALYAVIAENFLGKEFEFEPRPGPFIALAVIGFVTAVIGHIVQIKGIVITGIALVFAGIIFAPLALYLSQRG